MARGKKVWQHLLYCPKMEWPICLPLCSHKDHHGEDRFYHVLDPMRVVLLCEDRFSSNAYVSSWVLHPSRCSRNNILLSLNGELWNSVGTPANICGTLLKHNFRISSRPLSSITVPTEPMKLMSICMPPSLGMKSENLSVVKQEILTKQNHFLVFYKNGNFFADSAQNISVLFTEIAYLDSSPITSTPVIGSSI